MYQRPINYLVTIYRCILINDAEDIPFILTGSVIYFYNVFKSFVPALPDLTPILTYSLALLQSLLQFMMGNQLMENLDIQIM